MTAVPSRQNGLVVGDFYHSPEKRVKRGFWAPALDRPGVL